jgi:glycosyltransferase involved in cell wall biosynthesis
MVTLVAGQPLRVAFLTYALHLGGAERWIISLCREFDRSRVIPTIVAVNNWSLIHQITRTALPRDVGILPSQVVADQWPAFADVVIGWGNCSLGPLATKRGVPTVSCIHGATLCSWTKLAVDDALASGAKLAGVNEACRGVLPAEHREAMTVLANGADPSRAAPLEGREATRAKLGIRPDQKVVAHIGRVMQDKDVPALASGVGALPEDWLLLVCGPLASQPPDMAAISRLAGDRMFYLPPRDHVGDLLAAADVFALLSPSEAHPLAMTEAWLAGVPVVATDLPWLAALEKKHGELAIKVAPRHDPNEVAAALEQACALPQPQRLQRQAIAQKHYTAAAMARRWEAWLMSEVVPLSFE